MGDKPNRENETLRWVINSLTEHIIEQREELERLREKVEATSEDEKKRIAQSGTEFWKATFEFFKQYTTIALASIAAFAALLGGFFSDPPTPSESVLGSLASWHPLLTRLLEPILSDRVLSLCIVVAFFGFAFGGVFAIRGMHYCRTALWRLRTVDNVQDFRCLRRQSGLWKARWGIGLSYLSATVAFFVVVLRSTQLP